MDLLIFLKICLFIFGSAWSSLLYTDFSCGYCGANCDAWASYFSGFSRYRTQAPGAWASAVAAQGLGGCGLWAPEHWLSSCGTCDFFMACVNFPDQGSNS